MIDDGLVQELNNCNKIKNKLGKWKPIKYVARQGCELSLDSLAPCEELILCGNEKLKGVRIGHENINYIQCAVCVTELKKTSSAKVFELMKVKENVLFCSVKKTIGVIFTKQKAVPNCELKVGDIIKHTDQFLILKNNIWEILMVSCKQDCLIMKMKIYLL